MQPSCSFGLTSDRALIAGSIPFANLPTAEGLLMIEILHQLICIYIYIMYICYTTRIPISLVYGVYIRSCRLYIINRIMLVIASRRLTDDSMVFRLG